MNNADTPVQLIPLETSPYYQNYSVGAAGERSPVASENGEITQQMTNIANTGENLQTHIEIPNAGLSRYELLMNIEQEKERIAFLKKDIREIEQRETTICGKTLTLTKLTKITILTSTVLSVEAIFYLCLYIRNQP